MELNRQGVRNLDGKGTNRRARNTETLVEIDDDMETAESGSRRKPKSTPAEQLVSRLTREGVKATISTAGEVVIQNVTGLLDVLDELGEASTIASRQANIPNEMNTRTRKDN